MVLRHRLLPLLLALILTFSACGGAPSGVPTSSGGDLSSSSDSQAPIAEVRIPYDAGDSLNPFTCATMQNHFITNLIFDSLVVLDPAYQAENRLAQELTREENRWIAKLRQDARFSDGTQVLAQDVAYSYGLARTGDRYGPALSGVVAVETPDESTVVFTLEEPDVFFDRSLCFPIVKLNTGELPIPMGSGRYLPNDQGDALVANPNYYQAVQNVKTVELVSTADLEDQSFAVMEKTIDLMYSDLRSELNLGLGTGHRQVQLSNLVFLGINSQGWGFTAPLRGALSALINRDDINRKAYLGFGSTTYSLVRPSYGGSASVGSELGPDRVAAVLDSLGYAQRDTAGYRMVGSKRFALRLMVNQENKARSAAADLIAGNLEQAGIQVTVEKVDYATYWGRIQRGEYDLYLGELRIPYNLDLSDFILPGGALGSGITQNPELMALYRQVKAGEASAADLDALLFQEMPVVPLLYRRGIICFSRDFSANIVATEQDIFYNIGAW